ncbi:DUF4250 domain-containing protein [Photobacterium profundum]|uniref:DUF4250 domain-containing protein n=1 Tax=Photobacterium profundum 3TCK TaxID=314280 RepID=Q1Z059_9GAMM|nr:DUF4250 domain-containing protein [Photobacterium profundum]EAS41964.1 hypothetical protein P3TCK_25530 [Photobacterium profundum 3TCK]PSV59198.1 DUF4250 domain-containing protein [Photobacterium profundum]
MNLSKYETMDPIMLMSIVNMKIRDEFEDLDSLINYFEIDKEILINRLKQAGFDYLPEVKQFR